MHNENERALTFKVLVYLFLFMMLVSVVFKVFQETEDHSTAKTAEFSQQNN